MWLKYVSPYAFLNASKYFYFLNYLTEWELVTRNNPFLSTHMTALMSQTASVMLLQLSLFSSSLQLHLTALNIVAFCSTASCRFCFSQITRATGSTAYHILVGDSSTYQGTVPESQTGQTPRAGEAGKQKMQESRTCRTSFVLDCTKALLPVQHLHFNVTAVLFSCISDSVHWPRLLNISQEPT